MEKGLQLSELQRYEMNGVECEGSHIGAAGATCRQQVETPNTSYLRVLTNIGWVGLATRKNLPRSITDNSQQTTRTMNMHPNPDIGMGMALAQIGGGFAITNRASCGFHQITGR